MPFEPSKFRLHGNKFVQSGIFEDNRICVDTEEGIAKVTISQSYTSRKNPASAAADHVTTAGVDNDQRSASADSKTFRDKSVCRRHLYSEENLNTLDVPSTKEEKFG